MKKTIKNIARILGWIVLGIVFLLVLVSLLIQTRPVKNKLAAIAENQSERFLNGDLSIGKIDGNFFTGIVIEDILLTYEADTILFIDELSATYNLWPIINGTIEIPEASIKEPYIYLEQYPDSTWNFNKIIKPIPEKKDTVEKASDANLNFPDFELSNGRIKIAALDTVIPKLVDSIHTQLSFRLSGDEMTSELSEFRLLTKQPDFRINQLELLLNRETDYFELKDFYLKTAKNQINGNASYRTENPREGNANLETEPIYLEEFEYFIPEFRIPAKPGMDLKARLNGDSVEVILNLEDQEQQINLVANSSNLAEYLFGNSGVPLEYQLDGELNQVKLGHWIGNPEIDYLINGNISAGGRGIEPADASIVVKANLNETVVEKQRLKELLIDLELYKGNLKGIVRGDGEFGWFEVEPQIIDILENPVYEATLETRELNLARLLGNDTLSSNLHLQATIDGKYFDPEKINANAVIKMDDSRFREIQLDTIYTDVSYSNENILIDSFWLKTQTASLKATGNYNLEGTSDLQLLARFSGTEEFTSYLPVDSLYTSGELKARLKGKKDSLQLTANLNLNESQFKEIIIQKLKLDAEGQIAENDTSFTADLLVRDIVNGEMTLDSLHARVQGNPDSLYVDANLANEDLNTSVATGFVPGDELKFTVNEWEINYKNQEWKLQQPPAIIKIDSVNYEVENFRLATGPADSAQAIEAGGKITRQGEEDFQLRIANIDITNLFETLETETEAEGILDINIEVTGTATSPIVSGNFVLDNAAFNDYRFTNFKGEIDAGNNQAAIKTYIVSEDSGKVDINAGVPLQLNLDTMGYAFNKDDSLSGTAVIDSFSLAILEVLDLTGDIAGYLEGNIDLGGTFESPDPKGNIRLVDASVVVDEYGIDYEEIKLNLNFLKNSVNLDTLKITSDDGDLTGTGKIDFSSGFYKGDISKSEIRLDFNQFNVVDHNQFNMQLSGWASLSGDKDNVIYDGDLKIPQSEFYLPAVLSMVGRANAPEMPKPILVRHADKMQVSLDSLGIKTFKAAKPDSVSFDYFDELEGQLRVRIPKNTWIKNEDLRIEISGELELIKNKEFFELFGSVEVVRGQYDLLGRTFVIEDGSISFQGGEQMMPRMNITASYTFRDAQRAEQELTVQVTGTAESPEVDFQLNGSSISEGDAMSYILFGKGMNELTMSEQENVEGAGGGSMAEKAAASVLSSQLTNFLSDKINVDYIEVKSEGSFDNASVVVGKYLTNDLFVSYEQRFGETDEQDIAKYEVKAEYELFRFLFFELNNSSSDSGFDIIVKFDVK